MIHKIVMIAGAVSNDLFDSSRVSLICNKGVSLLTQLVAKNVKNLSKRNIAELAHRSDFS